MLYEKKKAVLSKALKSKATPVKVVNKVEIAEKEYPKPKPTVRLSTDDIKDIKNWSVGKEYTIQLTVKQTSMRQGREYEFDMDGDDSEKNKVHATFEVIEAKAVA